VDVPARVVINERTGTVVMGADVQVSAVAVAHGGLSIEVQRSVGVSQPAPFSAGQTAVVSQTSVSASEKEGQLRMVEGVSIGELVAALNNMGVKPRDLIVILQAIRAAGALHAEIVAL
jgi:flagellar P-ring protein precursor FlgI